MNVRRGAVVAAIVWLLVVLAGATLVWAVISRAGQGVVTSADPVVDAREEATPASSPDPTGSAGPTRTSGPKPKSPRPSEPRSPTSTAGTSSPAGPSPSSPLPSPTRSSDTASPRPSPVPVRRTWQDAAGFVSVECMGPSIRLAGAQPNSGYAIEVDDSGPDRVRVEFESGGEEERRTRVEARCAGGAPAFEVDTE